MKKILSYMVISLFFSMFLTFEDVSASAVEKLEESEDYSDVQNMSEEILNFINNGPVDISVCRYVTEADIDYDNAVKEYLDTPLVTDDIIEYTEVRKALSESAYMWIIPVRADGYLYEACVARKSDENEQQTGPWKIEGVYVYEPGNLTLLEQLSASLSFNDIDEEEYEFRLVGGVSPIRHPVFIALDDEKVTYMIPARSSSAAMITDSSATRSTSDYKEYNKDSSDKNGFPAYDYEKVITAAKEKSISFGQGSGTPVIDIGKKPIPYELYLAGIVLGIIMIVFISISCRKRKNKEKAVL